jgi:hypothetical protein
MSAPAITRSFHVESQGMASQHSIALGAASALADSIPDIATGELAAMIEALVPGVGLQLTRDGHDHLVTCEVIA